MAEHPDDLLVAYKKETDVKVFKRILAVRLVLENDREVWEAAEIVDCSENSVRNWIQRFAEAGIDGLRDLPRSGRPSEIPKKILDALMEQISKSSYDTKMVHEMILEATGVYLSMCQVRKILHRYGMSLRKTQTFHVNHATKAQVYMWQWYMDNVRIPRLKQDGFTLVAVDEAHFVQGDRSRSVWGLVGTRSVVPYLGNHVRVSMFGCITEHGLQLFRAYTGTFQSKHFIKCLNAMRRSFGKVAILCDRWSVHTSEEVRQYLKSHPDVKIIWLPVGSPYLNVVEQCWNLGKQALLGTVIYQTAKELKAVISEYYRTTSFAHLDLFTYLYRSPAKLLKDL